MKQNILLFKKHKFLFEELVKRDFKKKYKRTVLGMAWSLISPLLNLLVMSIVFSHFFASDMEHYIIYLFCGNLIFSYFTDSSSQGMLSLIDNVDIFSKVSVPKYLFALSKNVQTLINFSLTFLIFLVFCLFDGVAITVNFLLLIYPIAFLVIFNIGIGLILSALYMFFRDIQYLWSIFTQLLMYMSAIFYTVDVFPIELQGNFLYNPVYLFILYFRVIVLEAKIPDANIHFLIALWSFVTLSIGVRLYKKNNTRFLYYV